MEETDYERAVTLIAEHPEMAAFVGPRPPRLLEAAESALGLRLPDDYRRFLLAFGAGSFGATEVYGVIDENFTSSSVPNGIWYTLTERRASDLAPSLVVIGNDGGGNLHCLDCALPGAPVTLVEPGSPVRTEAAIAANFGAYLLDAITAELDAV